MVEEEPIVCRHCFMPVWWSETAQRWIPLRGLLFHPPHPHEPEEEA
jgi:hypothetical protein